MEANNDQAEYDLLQNEENSRDEVKASYKHFNFKM